MFIIITLGSKRRRVFSTSLVQTVSPTRYTVGSSAASKITPIASPANGARTGFAYISTVPWEPPVFLNVIPLNSRLSKMMRTSLKPCEVISSLSAVFCTKIGSDFGIALIAVSSQWSRCVCVTTTAVTLLNRLSIDRGKSTIGILC